MTTPTTLRFGKFKIYLEDPDAPGTYILPCGFRDKSMDLDAATQEEALPDCDDPDAAAWLARAVSTLSATVTGNGLFAIESYATWRRWMLAADSRNVRVVFDDVAAGYYQGAAVLTKLGHAVQLGQRIQASVSLASDGAWAWTDGQPA